MLPFLKQELAPYAGRGALVARMVIASTAVMLITMIFRIPFGSHGAIYTFLISRESPRSTFATAMTLVLAFSASAAFVLVGSIRDQATTLNKITPIIHRRQTIFCG